ncbi:MAG: hypothetical protein U0Z44_03375 [Kouleothrix sp.]
MPVARAATTGAGSTPVARVATIGAGSMPVARAAMTGAGSTPVARVAMTLMAINTRISIVRGPSAAMSARLIDRCGRKSVALGESGTSAPLRKSALPPNDQHHVVGLRWAWNSAASEWLPIPCPPAA